jgi:[protein-PII] uridylyltransferase
VRPQDPVDRSSHPIVPAVGLQQFRVVLAEEEAAIRELHFTGAGGNEVVQRRTALIDRLLREVWNAGGVANDRPALVAVGGYGRGELNPRSDVDILFLCRNEREREQASPVLYLLWDIGLDIGHSVRSVAECVDLARSDPKIRTSLLESRLLAGDQAFYQEYRHRMSSEVFNRKTAQFITEKIAERNAMRQKYGGSLYLREPNIKESVGGLRDIHLARWIALTRFGVAAEPDLLRSGIVGPEQIARFIGARNFLWRLRNEVHYLSDRKNDQLTYDLQEQTARDFRYRDSAHLSSVERFMKSYFLHARTIQDFTRVVVERSLPARSRGWFDVARQVGSFSLRGKTLFSAREGLFRQRPEAVFEAFSIVQSHGVVLSDRLRQELASCGAAEVRASAPAAAIFLSMLDAPDRLADTLTLMRDTGLLGRYLPEFRAVQALAPHDHYHKYTVDEHILAAVRNLEDVRQMRSPALETLSQAMRDVTKRWVLMLAVLLHDLGKAFRGDHERHGRDIAAQVLLRLGVSGDDRERILFLVENHLLMSVLSQRRELDDRKVIDDFARTVRDPANLRMLYLLTYADMSAVGPAAWTGWKAALLQDLYLRTLRHFDKAAGAQDDRQTRFVSVRRHLASSGFPPEEIEAFLQSMPPNYVMTASRSRMLDHLQMVHQLPADQFVIRHRHRFEHGYTDLTVCAYDAYGMFYRTAATIAAQNLSILRAQVYTARNGIMIDTFQITNEEGAITTYEEVWATLEADLRDVLTGKKPPPEAKASLYGRTVPGDVSPSVAFDNETSPALTIIDIKARDRIGLLYRIARILYDLNIDIASAKISTEGIRAMDSFYVTDLLGGKIADPDRLARIRDALLNVLA